MANKNTKRVNNARKKHYAHSNQPFSYERPSRNYVSLNRGIKSGIQPGSFVTVDE